MTWQPWQQGIIVVDGGPRDRERVYVDDATSWIGEDWGGGYVLTMYQDGSAPSIEWMADHPELLADDGEDEDDDEHLGYWGS